MKVEIKRCFMRADIKKQAGSLKEEIDRKFSVTSKIRMGGPGALDVIVDGRTIFSAKAAKRMPTAGEILGSIASLQTQNA